MKTSGDTRVWTGDLSICSRMLYHWAISPPDYSFTWLHYKQIEEISPAAFKTNIRIGLKSTLITSVLKHSTLE